MKTYGWFRVFSAVLLFSLLLFELITTVPVGIVHGAAFTFTPQADAYVNSGSPTTNYGSSTNIRTDGSPIVNSYLRFNVQGTGSNPPASAILRIYANSSSTIGFDVHGVSDNTWGETTITYANAPAFGGITGSSGSFAGGVWLQVDVTALVSGDGLYSFAMTSTSATAVSYASREAGANAPQLVLTLASPSATPTLANTSTPTPTSTPGASPSSTPTLTATPTNVVISSATPTSTGLPPGTPTSTATASPAPSATPTSAATATSTPRPTPTATATPTSTPIPSPTATPTAIQSGTITVLAAGDIASCSTTGDAATAALLAQYPAAFVLTLGDNAYPYGSSADFTNCYDPNWGPFKPETFPSIGNHEYLTTGASGYFGYFGAAAGDPNQGYYSFNLGAWHFLAVNSNCSKVGGCGVGSPQETWLKADLAAHPTACTLAYWHHPRFSSGKNGSFTQMQPIWQDLYNAHAEIVLDGHDHDYERFAPQSPSGVLDIANGITEFVVGTGGSNHTSFSGSFLPNSLVQNADTFGVLKLVLGSNSYSWTFLPVSGKTFTDSGSVTCH